MSWHDPATELDFAVDEIPPATKWNKIGADLAYLYGGLEGYLAYGSTGQSIPTSTDTKMQFASNIYDRGGGVVAYSAGNITIGSRGGVFSLCAGLAASGSGVWTVKIMVNGTLVTAGEGQVIAASCAITRPLVPGDVVTSWAHTTSAATLVDSGQMPFFGVQIVA
jgi:hypothetical protein